MTITREQIEDKRERAQMCDDYTQHKAEMMEVRQLEQQLKESEE